MKLWYSFIKELKLASKGFYFYIELFTAVMLLMIMMFVVPENFNTKQTEYLYFDLPNQVKQIFISEIEAEDLNKKVEKVEIKVDEEVINVDYYETSERKIYVSNNSDDIIKLSKDKGNLGAIIKLNEQGKLNYKYYIQGYESKKLKNLLKTIHIKSVDEIEKIVDSQEIRVLSEDVVELSDKENVVPVFLALNGSMMGIFIIAAYIFLDKQDGVIKAYAVTASSVWQYLMSKILVILVTTIVSSLIMTVPIMGLKPNYTLLMLFLTTTGFFAASLGLLVASFYKNIMQAFGAIYILIIVMMIPSIAYFIPSWEPIWIKILPTHPMLEGFKEILMGGGDVQYVLGLSLIFLILGAILFFVSNVRYKKTLTV